jgi:hypothetical protein
MPLQAGNCFMSVFIPPKQYPESPKTSQLGNCSYGPKSKMAAGFIEIKIQQPVIAVESHIIDQMLCFQGPGIQF